MLKSISVTESGGSCSSCRSRSRRFYSGRRWAGATKGLVAGILKNGFPRRITLTRRLRGSFLSFYFSLSLSLLPAVLSALCLHRGPFGRIFFGKRRETCAACPRRTIVLLRQITHLSGWRQNKGSRHGIVSCKKSCQDFAPNSVTPFHPPSTLRDGTIPDRLWFVEPVYPKRKLFGKII